jgi:threonine dehydrogenase-like Zn-dependent dehydrogenase
MNTMVAAVFKGNGILDVEEIQKPEIKKPDDVLIKVEAASICGSDLHILHIPPGQYGKPGTVMGHEFFGLVEEVGTDVSDYKPGDYVVVDPIVVCHACEYCKRGMTNLCPDAFIYGQTLNGGFAQYAVIAASQLYHMPAAVPAHLAAQTEPLSCVMNGMRKIKPTPTETVMIYGAGPIGLTFIRVMKLYGIKRLAVCEMGETRREKALKSGADLVIDPSKEDVETKLKDTWGDYCDVIVDAVGVSPVFGQAVKLLKCGGRLLIFGQNATAVSQVPPAVIVRNELTVMGSYCAFHTFPLAISLLQDERLELERIISHRFELKNIKQGIELLNAQQASRVIIYPNGMK